MEASLLALEVKLTPFVVVNCANRANHAQVRGAVLKIRAMRQCEKKINREFYA